jgi:hypothetical protein
MTAAGPAGGGDVGWLSVETIGYLAGALILLATFVFVELRSARPMLPMRILLDRNREVPWIDSSMLTTSPRTVICFSCR